jgi:hypothetical protein
MNNRFLALASIWVAIQTVGVYCVPNVTVIPLSSNSCAAWPGAFSGGGDTGRPFRFVADQVEDDALNGLRTTWSLTNGTWGDSNYTVFGVDLRKSTRFAKYAFQCIKGRVSVYPNGGPLFIGKDKRNGFLQTGEGYKLEAYAHEIGGVRQPDVFIGTLGNTTWGFNYWRPEKCGELDYYEAKMQGLPQDPNTVPRATYDPEFLGFLKVVPV